MANDEKEVIIDGEENNENKETPEENTEETPENVGEEKKQERPVETPAERVARLDGMLRRAKKDAGMQNEEPQKKSSKSDNLDYGQKAFLIANGIKGVEEMDFVRNLQKETGKDIDSLLETTYFQTELKEFREKKATSDATPKGGKRSNNSSVDSVEYWIAKGELPTGSDNKELREKVVNARITREKNKGTFYNS